MTGTPLQPPKVLVIDDDPGVAESLVEFLSDFGIEVEAEDSAVAALQRLEQQPYDVAIVDLQLPEMSGEELILLARQATESTGFLIVTGSVSYSLPPQLEQLGMRPEHVFQKPVPDLNKLVTIIEQLTIEMRA